MSDLHLRWYTNGAAVTAVALPFDLDEVLAAWSGLRVAMAREVPAAFTRDEWAYLIAALDAHRLRAIFERSFGAPCGPPADGAVAVLRPRGLVAVWLPNNVSLLGPLSLVLLSLTGAPLALKAGSSGEDLGEAFLSFALAHLGHGPLRAHLEGAVERLRAERDDPRVAALAARAAVRIVFGSDAAAAAIHALPHPLESVPVSFADRRSEAWLDRDALTDEALAALIKVFAVYGQAGCTSPRKVVLLDGTAGEARALRDRLAALWPRTVRDVPQHVASANLLGWQWAAALGWDAVLPERCGAVLAVPPAGAALPEEPASPLFLPVVGASLEEAVAALPPHAQTLGHAFSTGALARGTALLARTRLKRVVPIARMHEFGPVWDGQPFWRAAFEETELCP